MSIICRRCVIATAGSETGGSCGLTQYLACMYSSPHGDMPSGYSFGISDGLLRSAATCGDIDMSANSLLTLILFFITSSSSLFTFRRRHTQLIFIRLGRFISFPCPHPYSHFRCLPHHRSTGLLAINITASISSEDHSTAFL